MTRRAARRRAARAASIPLYLAELRPVRGRCTNLVRKRVCGSRYAVPRVSVDLTEPARLDKLATLECVECGHVWRRIPAPPVTDGEYQAVRLTLLLPAEQRRWYARGRWHAEGESGVVREATLADYMAALDDWRKRNGTYLAARERAAERRREAERAAHERAAALLATWQARDAERAAEEAAAAAREAA